MTLTVNIQDDEQFLSHKMLQGRTMCKAEAARWIGMTPQNLNNWIRAGKIKVEEDDTISALEVARCMRAKFPL